MSTENQEPDDKPQAPTTAAKKQKTYTWAVLVAVLAGIFVALASHEKLDELEAQTYDARLKLAAKFAPVKDVSNTVLAPIDDNAVARYGRWPWSRDRWAPILKALNELGVDAVSFDIEFPEKSEPVLRRSVTGVPFQKLIEREIDSLEVQITPEILMVQFAGKIDTAVRFADDALQAALQAALPGIGEQVVSWLDGAVAPGVLVRLAALPLGLPVPVMLDRARPEAVQKRADELKALAAQALAYPPAERAAKVKFGTAEDEIALKVMLSHPGIHQGDRRSELAEEKDALAKFEAAGLKGDAFQAKDNARMAIANAALDRIFEKGPQLLPGDVFAELEKILNINRQNAESYQRNVLAARARALARAQVVHPIGGLVDYLDSLMQPPAEAAVASAATGNVSTPEQLAASANAAAVRSAPFLPLSRLISFVGLTLRERLEPAAVNLAAGLNESTAGLRRLMARAVSNPDDEMAAAINHARQRAMQVCGVFYTSGGLNLSEAQKEAATDEFIRSQLKKPIADRLTPNHQGQMEEPYRRILRGFTVNPAAGPEDPMWKDKLGFQSLEDVALPTAGATATAAPAKAAASELRTDLDTAREQVLDQALDLELAGRPDLSDADLMDGLGKRFGGPLNEFVSLTVMKLVPPARARALSKQRFLVSADTELLKDSPRFYGFTPPILDITRAYSGIALSVMAPDPDGVMRRVPLLRRVEDGFLPGMSFMLFLHAMGFKLDDVESMKKAISIRPGPVVRVEKDGKAIEIPVDARGAMLLRMQGTESKLDRLALASIINYLRLKDYRREIQKNANPQEFEGFNILEEAVAELVRAGVAPVTLEQIEKHARSLGAFELTVVADRIRDGEKQGAKPAAEWQNLVEVWRERAFTAHRAAVLMRARNFRKAKDREAKMKRNPKQWTQLLAQADQLEELEFAKKELTARLKGKMLIIGAAQTGNTDSSPTPFTSKDPNYALHSHGVATMMSGQFVRRPPHRDATLIPIVVLAIAVGLILPRVPMVFGALWTFVLIALWGGLASVLLAYRGVWVDVVSPWVSVTASYLLISAYRYGTVERSKQVYREMFKAYLDERVIEQFVERPELFKEIGGISMEITAFFSDIEGFTTISETLSPEALSKMLEDYLTPMTDIIQGRGGLRDKYIGDAIVAMFGAPVHVPDHAIQGCLASLEQKERLAQLKKDERLLNDPKSWLSVLRSKGRDFNARMGVNTGLAKVGNFGSSKSKNYTMIGDTVNLAARLEGANKAFGTYLMISEFTYAQAREYIEARPLDSIRVKGKLRPVTVYELMAKKGKLTQLQEDVRGIYVAARELYLQQRFTEAIAKFQEALKLDPDDPPCLTLMHRSEHFIHEPPAKDWDGTYDLKEK